MGRSPIPAGRTAAVTRPGGRSARVRAAVFAAAGELLLELDWSRISMAKIAERAGVNPTTVYRRWGSLPCLIGQLADAAVSEQSPLADTGTLAGDIRAHCVTLVNDLTGDNRRFFLRALIISGDGAGDDGAQQALIERTHHVDAMFERAAQRGERSIDPRNYFDAVIGPLYGYALMMPGLVRTRAPALVEQFIAAFERPTPPKEPMPEPAAGMNAAARA